MLSFKKKKHPAIKEILSVVDKVATNLMQIKQNKQYQPTQDDLQELQSICKKLHHAYSVAGYVERSMQQRFAGEPEGANKFTNPEASDYYQN